MTYEEFKKAWTGALHHSGLVVFGAETFRERLDLMMFDRTCETKVALRDPQIEPFTIGADVWWRWASSHSARTQTTEEEFVTELVGIKATRPRTERPTLRIDAEIFMTLPYGRSLALPIDAWPSWCKRTVKDIVALEPRAKPGTGAPLVSLKWQGAPAGKIRADAKGVTRVERIDLNAWTHISLPRRWSDSSRKADPHPGPALDQMFKRLEDALRIWTSATVELLGTRTEKVTDKRRPAVGTTTPVVMATPGSSSSRRTPAAAPATE